MWLRIVLAASPDRAFTEIVDADGDGTAASIGIVYNMASTAPVNPSSELDQQAATMLQYQQAYQAMAEVIQVSGQLFNSLISAVSANGAG